MVLVRTVGRQVGMLLEVCYYIVIQGYRNVHCCRRRVCVCVPASWPQFLSELDQIGTQQREKKNLFFM